MGPRISEETLGYSDFYVYQFFEFEYEPCCTRHALDHMVMDFRASDENIRQHKTLSEETMLGKITTLAAMCPAGSQASILPRFFQRFCLFLSFHWENICNSGVNEDAR